MLDTITVALGILAILSIAASIGLMHLVYKDHSKDKTEQKKEKTHDEEIFDNYTTAINALTEMSGTSSYEDKELKKIIPKLIKLRDEGENR